MLPFFYSILALLVSMLLFLFLVHRGRYFVSFHFLEYICMILELHKSGQIIFSVLSARVSHFWNCITILFWVLYINSSLHCLPSLSHRFSSAFSGVRIPVYPFVQQKSVGSISSVPYPFQRLLSVLLGQLGFPSHQKPLLKV